MSRFEREFLEPRIVDLIGFLKRLIESYTAAFATSDRLPLLQHTITYFELAIAIQATLQKETYSRDGVQHVIEACLATHARTAYELLREKHAPPAQQAEAGMVTFAQMNAVLGEVRLLLQRDAAFVRMFYPYDLVAMNLKNLWGLLASDLAELLTDARFLKREKALAFHRRSSAAQLDMRALYFGVRDLLLFFDRTDTPVGEAEARELFRDVMLDFLHRHFSGFITENLQRTAVSLCAVSAFVLALPFCLRSPFVA